VNYRAIHDRLILSARGRAKPLGYTERHHVLPRSMGGGDESENIVVLTAREHYIVHWLLFKIHRTRAMALAWNRITHGRSAVDRYTSHTFAYARRAKARFWAGENHPFFGSKLTEEHKANLAKAKIGKTYRQLGRAGSPLRGRATSESHRENIRRAVCGRQYSAQARESLSKAMGSISGAVGVRPSGNRWRASLYVDGAREHLGTYDTLAQAIVARRIAEHLYLGKRLVARGA